MEYKVLSELALFDVHCYLRFKDDILIILSCDRARRLALINRMKLLSRVWALKVESIDDSERQFLNLHISKGETWRSTGHLDTRIFHRAHPNVKFFLLAGYMRLTHKAWLRGMVTRAYRLCSSKASALQEVQHLKCMVGARLGVDYAEQLIPSCPPAASHRNQFGGITSRVILPFFRHWQFGSLASVVRRTSEEHEDAISRILGCCIRVQLCYTLPAPHLHVRFLRISCPRSTCNHV